MSVGIGTGGAMRARQIGHAINIGVLSTNGAFYLLVYGALNDFAPARSARPGLCEEDLVSTARVRSLQNRSLRRDPNYPHPTGHGHSALKREIAP
jgi:hypothetical protein